MDSPDTQKPNLEARSIPTTPVSKWWRLLWGPLLVAFSALIGGLAYFFVVLIVWGDKGGLGLAGVAIFASVLYTVVEVFVLSWLILAWIRQRAYFTVVLRVLIAGSIIYFVGLSIYEPIRKRQGEISVKKAQIQYQQEITTGKNAKAITECAGVGNNFEAWKGCVNHLIATASDYEQCKMQASAIEAGYSATVKSHPAYHATYDPFTVCVSAFAKATKDPSVCRALSFTDAQQYCLSSPILYTTMREIASSILVYRSSHGETFPADGTITAGANGSPVLTDGLQSATLSRLPTIPINTVYYYRHAGTNFIIFFQGSDDYWYYVKPSGQSGNIKGPMPTCTAQACP